MSIQNMEDLKQQYLDEMKSMINQIQIKDYRNEKIDIPNVSTHTPERSRRFNSIYYDDDDDEESTIPLRDIIFELPLSVSIVEDLVPIPSESEDTSENDSDRDLPSCNDFSPINVFEEKSVTFSNPLFDSNDDCTSSDDESLSDEDVPEDKVKIYSNPLFEFDDEYISSDVNPLFDEVFENIESKESYVSNLDELALLATPLFDTNEDECFDPGGVIGEIDAFLDMDISTDIENGYHDLKGDIIYLKSLLIDDTIPNLPPEMFLDHDPISLKDEPDNDDLMTEDKQRARKLHFELSFADALLHMPKFATMFKCLLNNKEKLFDLATTPVNENCSAVILKKFPKKLRDPGKFLIPCDFPELDECLAFADLGKSINLMPLSIWNKLSLPELTSTQMILELADRSTTRPAGIVEDVFVKVGKFHFPTDFVVVDYVVDPRVPLILRRPFLRTGRALINVYGEELTLRHDDEAVTFKVGQTSRYFYNDVESINRINVIDIACREDSDFLLEETDAFLAIEDDSISPKIDNSYYDSEGDIHLLEEFLNDDPSSPHPSERTIFM
ncbi:reverse transcriptase domain-containing protein [Tanacetum coccineum]